MSHYPGHSDHTAGTLFELGHWYQFLEKTKTASHDVIHFLQLDDSYSEYGCGEQLVASEQLDDIELSGCPSLIYRKGSGSSMCYS